MKIIADQQIPYLSQFFGDQSDLITLSTEEISANAIKNADVLLIRSTTRINKALVFSSSIQFIGSATAGIDHIDTQSLAEAGIAWAHAPGCNAKAVADYVWLSLSSLMPAFEKRQILRAGVIGVGHVGRQVSKTLQQMGFDVVLHDPPRADQEADFVSTPLDQFYDLDLICLHTPLTVSGPHPTKHLIDTHFLSKLNPNSVLLNAGRGACVDSHALKKFQTKTILDVWENEPDIDSELAQSALIATPHIAGYSELAKYRATQQLFEAFCRHFKIKSPSDQNNTYSAKKEFNFQAFHKIDKMAAVENLKQLSEKFKESLKQNPTKTAEIFNHFRKNYQFRPEIT